MSLARTQRLRKQAEAEGKQEEAELWRTREQQEIGILVFDHVRRGFEQRIKAEPGDQRG